jgi:transcription initiation factor TFIIF subunit beta
MVVFGEARSALYEAMKRDARKKERRKKWEPYVRRTVPSTFILLLEVKKTLLTLQQNKPPS